MNKPVIRAKNLTKIYRLYHNQRYRLLDAFGLLVNQNGKFDTHTALDNINLEIYRGEKIAIIGRNGAGKSTLLKLICKVIRPTTGEIEISGNVHPLLEIGTGFLPDFTGRENVYAYLANYGVTGQDADQRFAEIVDFSELEEYIDQPAKTYSTGMKMRLMFAASTSIHPDILLLDEVLSVGDAYFTQKSYERIRDLCSENSTLILVTHDIYSAMNICDRFILLDNGKVKADGKSTEIHTTYADSIRKQEEHRLQLKRKKLIENKLNIKKYFYCELRTAESNANIFISDIILYDGNDKLFHLDVSDKKEEDYLITDTKESNWSEITIHKNKYARKFNKYGSIYHKLSFILPFDGDIINNQLKFFMTYYCDRTTVVNVEIQPTFSDDIYKGDLKLHKSDQWDNAILLLKQEKIEINDTFLINHKASRFGTKHIEITDIKFMDINGNETLIFDHDSSMKILMNFRINEENINEKPTICITFFKDGIVRTHRFWTNDILFSFRNSTEGTIEVAVDSIQFTYGTYIISFTIFREGYLEKNNTRRYFSISEGVYDSYFNSHEISINKNETSILLNDVLFTHPARWSLH
ncbi:MAG: transporter protein [Gammaproteobacteria bacterium]|nr:ABC transporter protein [Gammaproteobacteria bacterium]MBM2829561.1 transporter protein [Gammaproteobacteria bacterium]